MKFVFSAILLCYFCVNVFGFIPQDYDSNKRAKSVLVPPRQLKFYKKKVSDHAIKPSTIPISPSSKPAPSNRRSWLFGSDDEDKETAAEDRIFFPPYKFPFWGLPYGVYSNGGFFNPGLFPFVPGGPGFPPYDGIFGGPFGPGEFPGSGPTPFTEQNTTSGLVSPAPGGAGGPGGPGNGPYMPGGMASMPGGGSNGSYYGSSYPQPGADNYHDYHHSFPPMPDGGPRASRSAELNKIGKDKDLFKKGKKKGKKAKVVAPVPVMAPPQVAYPAQQLPTYTVKPIKGKLVKPQIIEGSMAQPMYPSYGSSYGSSYGASSYGFPHSLGYVEPYGPQYEHEVPLFGTGPVPMYSGYVPAPPYPVHGHHMSSYGGHGYYPPPYGGHGYYPPSYGGHGYGYQPPPYAPSYGGHDHKKYKSKDKPSYPSDGYGPPDKYMYPYGGNSAYTSTPEPYTPPPPPPAYAPPAPPYAPPPPSYSYTTAPAPPPEDTTAAPAPPPDKPKKAKATYVTNVIQYACGSGGSGHHHYSTTSAPPSPPPTYAPATTTTTTAYTTTTAPPPPETTSAPPPPPTTTSNYEMKKEESSQSAAMMPPPPASPHQQPHHNGHSESPPPQYQNQHHQAGQEGQHYHNQNHQPYQNHNGHQPPNPQHQAMSNQHMIGHMQQSPPDQHYMHRQSPQQPMPQQPPNHQQQYHMPSSQPDPMQASGQNYHPSYMNPSMQQQPNQHQGLSPESQPGNGNGPPQHSGNPHQAPVMPQPQYPPTPPQPMPPVPPPFMQSLAEPEWDPMDPMGMGPILYSVPGYNRRQFDSSQPAGASRQTRLRTYKSIQFPPIKFKDQTPELLKIPASWSKRPVGSGRVPKPQQQISARSDTDSSKITFVPNRNTIPGKLDDVVKISVEETISSVSKHTSSSMSPHLHKRSKRNAPRRGPPPRRPPPPCAKSPYPNRCQHRKRPCCRPGDPDKPHFRTPLRPRYPPRRTTVRPRYNQAYVSNNQQYSNMPIPNAPIPQPVADMPLVSEVPVVQEMPVPPGIAPVPILPAYPGPPPPETEYPSFINYAKFPEEPGLKAEIPLPAVIEETPMYPQGTEEAQPPVPGPVLPNPMTLESETPEKPGSVQTGDIYADYSSVVPHYSTSKPTEAYGSPSKARYEEPARSQPVSSYTSEEHLVVPEAAPQQPVVQTSFNEPSSVEVPDLKPLNPETSVQPPPAVPVPNTEAVSIHLPEITPVIYGSPMGADTAVVGIPIPNGEPLPPIIKDFKVEEFEVPMPPPAYLSPGAIHSYTVPEIASKIVPSYAADTSLSDYKPIHEVLNSPSYYNKPIPPKLPNRWLNQPPRRGPPPMPYHPNRPLNRYPRMNSWRRGEDHQEGPTASQSEGTQPTGMDLAAGQIMTSQPTAQGPNSETNADSTLLTFNLDHDTPTKLGYRIGVYSQSDPSSKGISSAFAAVGPKSIIAYAKAPAEAGTEDKIKYVHDQEAGLLAFRSPSKASMALGFIENRDQLRQYEFLDDYTLVD